MKPFGYDPKCGELAEHFLRDSPMNNSAQVDALATAIQEAVEQWVTNDAPWCHMCDHARAECQCVASMDRALKSLFEKLMTVRYEDVKLPRIQ